MKILKNLQPPTGLSRLLFRIPIHVYRLGFGWPFGDRPMLLNHVGRATGKQRQTVLEEVIHDPTEGSFVVASGWDLLRRGTEMSSTRQSQRRQRL